MVTVVYNWDAALIINRVLHFDSYFDFTKWYRGRHKAIVIQSITEIARAA